MNLFLRKDLPYFLTILIGLAAYQINNVIALYTDTPVLAYEFETISSSTTKEGVTSELECRLVNYNRKEAIRDINITMSYKSSLPSPKKVEQPDIIPVAPSAILPDSARSSAFGLINEYKIPILHPFAEYVLKLETTAHPDIKEHPKLYLKSSESIRLVESNFEIFLVKNQVLLNALLLFIWVSFALVYMLYLSNLKPENDET